MSGALSVAGLAQRFGERAILEDVSLSVAPGRIVALIGPTGCGKSTLLRVLAGLVIPTAGTALVDGATVIGRPGRCALMPQADTLLPWRRALDNAMLAGQLLGRSPAVLRDRARELFARFGLDGFEAAWPHELSGGMRQRVALLRTVLADLPVMLLDEPFGALDALTRLDLQSWLIAVHEQAPLTTIVVTHDIDEALRLADTVLVMSPRPGRIVGRIAVSRPRPDALALTTADFAIMKREIIGLLGAGVK